MLRVILRIEPDGVFADCCGTLSPSPEYLNVAIVFSKPDTLSFSVEGSFNDTVLIWWYIRERFLSNIISSVNSIW
ncbi:MAG: hypothetical protein WKG07_21175 [Hymenobacter sp.]